MSGIGGAENLLDLAVETAPEMALAVGDLGLVAGLPSLVCLALPPPTEKKQSNCYCKVTKWPNLLAFSPQAMLI